MIRQVRVFLYHPALSLQICRPPLSSLLSRATRQILHGISQGQREVIHKSGQCLLLSCQTGISSSGRKQSPLHPPLSPHLLCPTPTSISHNRTLWDSATDAWEPTLASLVQLHSGISTALKEFQKNKHIPGLSFLACDFVTGAPDWGQRLGAGHMGPDATSQWLACKQAPCKVLGVTPAMSSCETGQSEILLCSFS